MLEVLYGIKYPFVTSGLTAQLGFENVSAGNINSFGIKETRAQIQIVDKAVQFFPFPNPYSVSSCVASLFI